VDYTLTIMRVKTFCAVTGMVLLTGCEKRLPVPSGGSPGIPHVGWVIMVGDRENPDREFVCQSDPRTDCVMPPSQPDNQAFTNTHFYLHSGTTDTKYTGTIEIGFFEGSRPHVVKLNTTVKGGAPAGNSSVSGIVSAKPGRYPMTIAVVAENGETREIRESVPVTVRPLSSN
jgi:hypothetical protein